MDWVREGVSSPRAVGEGSDEEVDIDGAEGWRIRTIDIDSSTQSQSTHTSACM